MQVPEYLLPAITAYPKEAREAILNKVPESIHDCTSFAELLAWQEANPLPPVPEPCCSERYMTGTCRGHK